MRYFFISYFHTSSKGFGFGSMGRKQQEGFPTKRELIEGYSEGTIGGDISILSIQELNKEDFEDFFELNDNPESEDSTK